MINPFVTYFKEQTKVHEAKHLNVLYKMFGYL